MISAAAPVHFEAIGRWIAESEEIPSDIPVHCDPEFFFSRQRLGWKSPVRDRASGSEGPSNGERRGAAARPRFSLRGLIASHGTACAYDVSYYLDAKLRRKQYQAISSRYDLIHLHSGFFSITSSRFAFLGAEQPIVVTLWGSDVLRTSDPSMIARQQRLLNRATLITHSTPEFREIILAKYGRHLAPKLRETYFSINDDMVAKITTMDRRDARKAFASQYHVPDDALIVCVGHNASPANQQIDVLQSIGGKLSEIRRPLFVVVPMTYCQTDKGHLDRVRDELQKQQLAGVVLTDFMNDDDLAQLRKATDIFVYAAISDVFSATISQGLIAGQVVITGSWLPNRARKQASCVFWEVDHVFEVGKKMVELCGPAWEKIRESVQINEALGCKFFDRQRLGKAWYDVYQDAVGLKERK